MAIAFWAPLAGIVLPDDLRRIPPVAALAAMLLSYLPTLRFYRRALAGAVILPLIGTSYPAMTWSSAIRYWRGERARWKDRQYGCDTGEGPRTLR